MMLAVCEGASTSCHPALAIAMLSMLLTLFRDHDNSVDPNESKLFFSERVENVRESTRNLMTYLGIDANSMVCPFSFPRQDLQQLQEALEGCPASGCACATMKTSFYSRV